MVAKFREPLMKRSNSGPSTDGDRLTSARFWIYAAFVIVCFAGGGASRADVPSLLYVRPWTVLSLAALLIITPPQKIDLAAVRVPLFLLLILILAIGIQLVPLPPAVWLQLPGMDRFAAAAAVADMSQPWRPMSISPDLTLNSLVSTIVPATALVGFACLTREQRRRLLPLLIVVLLCSAILAITQLAGGQGSPFYLYKITNPGKAVGLFANRNHQALLIASGFPLLALWAARVTSPAGTAASPQMWIAAGGTVLLVPMLLLTGSRAGLLLGAAAFVWSTYQFLLLSRSRRGDRRVKRWAILGVAAMGVTIAGFAATINLGRAEALQRLLQEEVQGGKRLGNVGLFIDMASDTFPFGSGWGTFDPLFRIYEPVEALAPTYLNHAHNDLLELAITAGAPGLFLLLAFVVWWLARSAAALSSVRSGHLEAGYSLVGAGIIALTLGSSLVDYPLRIPAIMVLFTIALGWLADPGRGEARVRAAIKLGSFTT